MNIKLLRRVQQEVLRRPGHLNMESFFSGGNRPIEHYLIHACDTTACIAGWCILLSPKKLGFRTKEQRMRPLEHFFENDGQAADTARVLLELDWNQCHRLFHLHAWPREFFMDYRAATTGEERAHVTVRRIDHFIKTKGQE